MSKPKLKKPTIRLKKPSKKFFTSTKFLASLLVILGLGGFGYSGYYYYQNVFTDYDRVFYSMIDKSLNTSSVYRTTLQTDLNNRKENQNVQIVFSPEPRVHSTTQLEQIAGQSRAKSIVGTETYGDKETDYVQYTNITIPGNDGQNTDYSKLLNTWAKRSGTDEMGQKQAQFMNDAAFTFIPFGNFPDDKRAELIALMKEKKVYDLLQPNINYDDSRPVMTVVASINPRKFVEVMVEYQKLTGIGNLDQLNPLDYEDRNVFGIELHIDVISRHLKKITFPEGDRVESFYGYGAVKEVEFPKQTISVEELQGRLQ